MRSYTRYWKMFESVGLIRGVNERVLNAIATLF